MAGLNANPTLFGVAQQRRTTADVQREADPTVRDPIDHLEVFDMLRGIKDPEHPHTLEQLRVVQPGLIKVDDGRGRVHIHFTPTIPHCSASTSSRRHAHMDECRQDPDTAAKLLQKYLLLEKIPIQRN